MADSVACSGCHYLVKTTVIGPRTQPHVQVVSELERAEASQGNFGWVREHDALSCHRGVWDEGRGSRPDQRAEQIARPRPADSCFFLQYTLGMSLPAALELSARELAVAEAKRNRRPIWVGVAIAAGTTALAYISVADTRHWWPF